MSNITHLKTSLLTTILFNKYHFEPFAIQISLNFQLKMTYRFMRGPFPRIFFAYNRSSQKYSLKWLLLIVSIPLISVQKQFKNILNVWNILQYSKKYVLKSISFHQQSNSTRHQFWKPPNEFVMVEIQCFISIVLTNCCLIIVFDIRSFFFNKRQIFVSVHYIPDHC